MPKVRIAQTNFSAGEFSPLMNARSDVKFYKNACKTLRNFRLHYQGGAAARYGTQYKATLAYSPARLLDFTFSESQYYWFAVADGTLEIFNSTGTLIQTSTGRAWTSDMLARLNWAQQGDLTMLLHPDLPMQKIMRTGSTAFTLSTFAFEADTSSGLKQPYYKFADPAITMQLSTLGAAGSTCAFQFSGAVLSTDHVGVIIRKESNQILVGAVTSSTGGTGTYIDTASSTAATTDWDEAVFSAARGYANSAVWFGDRLWLGGSKSHPIGLWGSRIGAYYNFDIGTAQANEAIWENAPASLLSEIRHLLDFRHLLVFGDRSLGYVPSSPDTPITPSNSQVVRQQPFGASYLKPKDFDGAAAYVQNSGLVAREGFWVDTDQAYKTPPISGLASHMIDQPTEIAASYGGSEDQDEAYLLLVNGDNTLSVFHSAREQEMAAWVTWTTEGLFRGVAAAPGRIAVLVERDLSSSTGVWCLEFFDEERAPLDCAARSTSTSTSTAGGKTFGGFTHLQGCTEVDVVTKGHYLGLYEVSTAGIITLDDDEDPDVTEIEAGFGYAATIEQLPADFERGDGNVRALQKRAITAYIEALNLTGLSVQDRDWNPPFIGDDFASTYAGYTGIVEMAVDGIDREAQFEVVIPRGRKGTILGITREIEVS